MSRTAQSVRAVLEYLLSVICLSVALLDVGGIGWSWDSFSTCLRYLYLGGPIMLLAATVSVFVSRFPRWRILLFGGVIGCSTLIYAIVSAGGLGICTDPVRVDVGLLPYIALLLLVGRIILVSVGRNPAEMKSEVRGV